MVSLNKAQLLIQRKGVQVGDATGNNNTEERLMKTSSVTCWFSVFIFGQGWRLPSCAMAGGIKVLQEPNKIYRPRSENIDILLSNRDLYAMITSYMYSTRVTILQVLCSLVTQH